MKPLHLVRLPVDARRLYRFARTMGVPARNLDDGYAVHALLSALTGGSSHDGAEFKPFSLDPSADARSEREIEVLGYASLDASGLAARAVEKAHPAALEACDLRQLRSKPMPLLQAGARVGFSVRACCVKRVAKRGNQNNDRAEIDAFLARVWEVNDASVVLDRETVYRDWLAGELAKGGGSTVVDVRVTSHKLATLYRRTQGGARAARRVVHPDVVFEGILDVREPEAFRTSLARGVGRHRAFGFGMLLLKRAP